MDNQELLIQVTSLIQNQQEMLSERFDRIENRLDNVENRLDGLEHEIKKTRLEMETNVAKRIEVLFDGYKLTHEKQWEQERKIEALQAQMEAMQIRLTSLENKGA